MPTRHERFGYSYAGRSFREVIRVVSDGFAFKGRWNVRWSEIVGYRAFPDFYPDRVMAAIGSPKLRIAMYTKDGRMIRIRGDVLVVDGNPMVRVGGIPEAFTEFVEHLREKGIPKWVGPKEEEVLFAVALALFVVGFLVGLVRFSVFDSRIAAAVIGGVLLAQMSFVIAPFVARRVRKAYIAKHGW